MLYAATARRTVNSISQAQKAIAHLVDKPLSNKKLGITATISGKSLGKLGEAKATSKSISARLHALAIANIDSLFGNAQFDITHADTKNREEVEQTHRLGSIMFDDKSGEYIPVMITVFEYQREGNRIYSIEAVDIEKQNSAGQLESSPGGKQSPIAEFNAKIAKLLEDAKRNPLRFAVGDIDLSRSRIYRSTDDVLYGEIRKSDERVQDVAQTNPVVLERDYHIATEGSFDEIHNSEYDAIDAPEHVSPSWKRGIGSRYKVKDGVLYRKADHWGKFATVKWHINDYRGEKNTSGRKRWNGEGVIQSGKIKIADLKRIPNKAYTINFLSTPQGEVYGFVKDGKIYLDPAKLSPELIAEEYTHIQQQALRLAANNADRAAQKIVSAWDKATGRLADAIIKGMSAGGMSARAKALLKQMGIAESELASEVYQRQDGESAAAYKTRLQDELWAKAQKSSFAKYLETLAAENKLGVTTRELYEALKDFAKYIAKQLVSCQFDIVG